MTEHEYFALMAEYLAQLEREVQRGVCSQVFGKTIVRMVENERMEWARKHVDAVFTRKETDHEKPA